MSRIDTPDAIEALTFDCYGTLIDWLGGVRAAVADVASLEGCDVDRLLVDRQAAEADIQRGDFETYDRVLGDSLLRAGREQGCAVSLQEAAEFARSMGRWPAFPDSRCMLTRLSAHYRLAILSNVQPDVLRESIGRLGVPFDVTVTAGEIRSYKPARAHFDEGLRRLGLSKERVLHCACSLYHDIVPGLELGWRVAWINREGEPVPTGLAAPVVEDLAGLVEILGC